MKLAPVDYLILAIYFGFVLGIGWLAKRKITSSADFLTSRHSVPVWITSLAFIAANLGAQEMIGMCASGAKYGIASDEGERAKFVIRAPYTRWKEIIRKELDPIKGMMQGKLRLKGDLPTIVRYVKAANELVNLAATVPTDFVDEKA